MLGASLSLLAGCTGTASLAYRTPASGAPGAATSIAVGGAGFAVQAAGTVSQATTDAAFAGVLATLNRYLQAGVLTPLRSGGPAGDLAPLFSGQAVARVSTGPDRPAFVDEGLPPTGDVRSTAAVATLTALAGADGTVSVVDANLDLRLTGEAGTAPVTVTRTGDMVLFPDTGTWLIDSYDITVTRTVGATTTTTTAHR